MMSYNSSTRTGLMLPYATIRHFLKDLGAPPYHGIPAAGFTWRDLVDPAKKAYLNVAGRSGGILVVSCLPGTGARETLRPNDAILKWDGTEVDNLGFYADPDFGRLAFPYLIMGHREPGDSVPVTLVRDGRETNVNVRLARHRDDLALVPENPAGERPEYLVDGGFVIRELDARYLAAHGNDWQQNVDSRLAHAYLTRRHAPAQPGQRVVILAAVLPDPINIGYQRFRDDVITHVNGEAVQCMDDVFRVVDRSGGVERLTLRGVGLDLVLNAAELAAANSRLASLYRIPELRHRRGGAPAGP
jgi:hypothetical protein